MIFHHNGNCCFYESYLFPILWKGVVYPSANHALLGTKTDLMEIKLEIATTMLPSNLKDLANTIPTPPYWTEQFLLDELFFITLKKFRDNPLFQEKLLATGNDPIVDDGDPQVGYYGFLPTNKDNHRGKILTKVREKLKAEGALFS